MNQSQPQNEPKQPETANLNQGQDLPPKFYEHATLLVLFYDRWFRFAAIFFVLTLITVGLMLPKLWRVTPSHMPNVRISGLDVLQSAALHRSALKQSAAGQSKEAFLSWRSSVDNNPGNVDLIREMIQYAVGQPSIPPEHSGYIAGRGLWLLGLSRTNISDLSLVTLLLGSMEEDAFLVHLADPFVKELPLPALSALAKAEFRIGNMDKFNKFWQLDPAGLAKDPEAVLYRTAWEAGWGPPNTLYHGQLELRHNLNNPDQAVAATAHHLELWVSLNTQDVVNYERALDWLVEHHEDRVTEHLNHWRLLAILGKRDEAIRLAQAFSRPPDSAEGATGIANVLSLLGLEDNAIEFLDKESLNFGYSPQVWIQLGTLRIKKKLWNDLFSKSIAMRRNEQLAGRLDGYSYFVEGMANVGTGRNEAAAKAFKTATGSRFDQLVYVAFSCAHEMRQVGYPNEASELLRKVQSGFTNQAEYWFELTQAAYAARDMETLATATEKAYQLEPDKDGYVNNYAAVLIAQRRNPQESVKLTNRLLSAVPGNVDLVINHSLALLQLGRFKDAEGMLKTINPSRLKPQEASVANYAWAEFHLGNKDINRARKAYALVNTNHLMAPQVTWMENQLKNL